MRELKFTKMQSLGNDFVMLDSVTEDIRITEDIARNIASRRFGIGCDQLIVAESGEVADLRMRIFNTDGSEVGQCGNGARCFAAFVHDRGLVGARVFDVETITTKLKLEIGDDGFVAVGMGRPEFDPSRIPLALAEEMLSYSLEFEGEDHSFTSMAIGNPHCTFIVADVDSAPLETLGPALQDHPLFPDRVNVGFAQLVSRDYIRLRVYERGVGETLGCGSGACAAAVSLMRLGKLDNEVEVELPGGSITVSWPGGESEVKLRGPINYVFEGVMNVAPDGAVS